MFRLHVIGFLLLSLRKSFQLTSNRKKSFIVFSPTSLTPISSRDDRKVSSCYWGTRLYQSIDAFDFSSKYGWETFYQTGGNSTKLDGINKDTENPIPFEYEWHASINAEKVISEVFPGSSVLMIGTGNSALPRHLYKHHNGQGLDDKCGQLTNITCMDYSSSCISMLEELFSKDCPGMKFVHGDATKLCSLFQSEKFDFIIDKGLMDALMCGEGWDWTVESYLKGAASILKSKESNGKIILISYKLSSATKQFLLDMGDKFGLKWNLDMEKKSNDKVSFSIATKL